MKFDIREFTKEHPISDAMAEICDDAAVKKLALHHGKSERYIMEQLNRILIRNGSFMCTKCNKIHLLTERASDRSMWCKKCNANYQAYAYKRSKSIDVLDTEPTIVTNTQGKQNMTELTIDVLLYLRNASKYDDVAKELYTRLLDSVKVTLDAE